MPKEELKNIDYLIANEVEAQQLALNFGIASTDAAAQAKAIAALGNLTCIITLGEKGSIAARGDELYKMATLPVEVVDTTGGGDAFCGIFAACLQAGHTWVKGLHYASVGAALSCLGLGAQDGMPFMEDIEKKLYLIPPPQKV